MWTFTITALVAILSCAEIHAKFQGAVPHLNISKKGQNGTGCHAVHIANGNMSVSRSGLLATVVCNSNYTLVDGPGTLACSFGGWETAIPKCVGTGCLIVEGLPHGQIETLLEGAIQKFHCNTGYTLEGSSSLGCNGSDWNSTIPTCRHNIDPAQAVRSCGFEEEDWCGWKMDNGMNSWQWRSGGPVQPGFSIPTTDHTTHSESGHFLYIDATESHSNTLLHSPVYSPFEENITCFVFYYHFQQHTTGYLTLHLLNEDTGNRTIVENLTGHFRLHHITEWSISYTDLTHAVTSNSNFQLLLEVKLGTGYNSDIAIDDVTLASGTSCFNYAQEWQEQEDSQYPVSSTTAPHVHFVTEDNNASTQLPPVNSTWLSTTIDMSEMPIETTTIKTTSQHNIEDTTASITFFTNSSEMQPLKSTVPVTMTSPSILPSLSSSPLSSLPSSSPSLLKTTTTKHIEQTTDKPIINFSTQRATTIKTTSTHVNIISLTPTANSIVTISSSSILQSDDSTPISPSNAINFAIILLAVVCVLVVGICLTLRYYRRRRKVCEHERLLDEPSYSEGAIQFKETGGEDSDIRESDVLVSYKVEDHLTDYNV